MRTIQASPFPNTCGRRSPCAVAIEAPRGTRWTRRLVVWLMAAGPLTLTIALAGPSAPVAGADSGIAAQLRALPEHDLKAFYLRCSRDALAGQLGASEIAVCSVGYEVLKQRSFGGDFLALWVWSRQQAPMAPESVGDGDGDEPIEPSGRSGAPQAARTAPSP